MIELKNIRKSFEGNEVLKNISASFEPGKTNLIIGKSGSGKTVLLKCMVGLLNAGSGNILYDKKDFGSMNREEKKEIRKEIGMLFQGTALFDSMTVEQNIIFPLNMFTEMNQKEKIERVNFCLEKVNMKGANNKFPSELSGGMKKRAGLARAIVLNPKYLFCDEPNSGLDPQTSIVIDELIKELTVEFKTTTIVNTHDMNSVMEIGDHIIFPHLGQIAWEGSNKDILASTSKELEDFIFASRFLKEVKHAGQKRDFLE